MGHLSFAQYLKQSPLNQEFHLTDSGNFSFHWADWERTCRFQKRLLLVDYEHGRLEGLTQFLNVLKERTVWLRYQEKLAKISLYELYESYWDGHLREVWFDREKCALLSLHNESGPYAPLSSLKWMDPQLSQLFVLRKILTKSMTLRSFRLRLNIPIACSYDASALWNSEMQLSQISSEGILISFEGRHNLNKLLASDSIQMQAHLMPLFEASLLKYKECFEHLEKADFSLGSGEKKMIIFKLSIDALKKYNNFEADRLRDRDHFHFFVKFKDLEVLNHEADFKTALSGLSAKVERRLERSLIKESA